MVRRKKLISNSITVLQYYTDILKSFYANYEKQKVSIQMKENRVAHHNISQFWITVIKKHNIIVLWPRYQYTASAGPWFPSLIIIVVLCVWIIDLLSGVNSLSALDAHVNLCVWNRLFLRNRMLSLCFGSGCLFSCQIPLPVPECTIASIGHSHAGLWRTVSHACLSYWLRIWRNLSIYLSFYLSFCL